jgi:hypothetical protein
MKDAISPGSPLRLLRLACAVLGALSLFWIPASAFAADPGGMEFRGLLMAGPQRLFLLAGPDKRQSDWIAIGESFEGWTVAGYREADSELRIRASDGTETSLTLASSKVVPAVLAANLGQARAAVLRMRWEEKLNMIFASSRKNFAATFREGLKAAGLPADTPEEDLRAEAEKLVELYFSGLRTPDALEALASIYQETYTLDELNGIADFTDTVAGQAEIEKGPEFLARISELFAERRLNTAARLRELDYVFFREQWAKAAASQKD